MPSNRPLPRSNRSGRAMELDADRRRGLYGMAPPMASRGDWRRELESDFAAMFRVWQMLRSGAVRMLGEIGRHY